MTDEWEWIAEIESSEGWDGINAEIPIYKTDLRKLIACIRTLRKALELYAYQYDTIDRIVDMGDTARAALEKAAKGE